MTSFVPHAGRSDEQDARGFGQQASSQGPENGASIEREQRAQRVAVQVQDSTVRSRIGHDEHHSFEPAVAQLQAKAALEGLDVPEAGFGLDSQRSVAEGRDTVPGAAITGDGERHLGAPWRTGLEAGPKSLQDSELRGIAHGVTVGVRSHHELEANGGAGAAELIDREFTEFAALDAAELSV
jgi:hypothetical protein